MKLNVDSVSLEGHNQLLINSAEIKILVIFYVSSASQLDYLTAHRGPFHMPVVQNAVD
jgi:hypothetical protein